MFAVKIAIPHGIVFVFARLRSDKAPCFFSGLGACHNNPSPKDGIGKDVKKDIHWSLILSTFEFFGFVRGAEIRELFRWLGLGMLNRVPVSFIHLKLNHCVFKHAVVVRWENLRTLHIEDAEIDHDSIKNILSGSPLLETLMLVNCCGFELLDITNKSVKNLVFSGYDAIYMHSVEINAPHILSLTIKAYLPLEKLLLRNVSSVIKAELDYYKTVLDDISLDTLDGVNEEMLEGLLFSLGHAKEVKIGKLCLEALADLKAEGFICPSNLKVVDN
ncbi:F-box protein-like protein [Tanacetum coccineum]